MQDVTGGAARRRVLVTGAAGRIGSALALAAAGRWRLRLGDLRPEAIELPPGDDHEAVRLDVTDDAACRAACAGVDAVVHLAADPDPAADFATSLLPVNVVGTEQMLAAALAAGVRRFVFASSLHVVGGHPPGPPLAADAAPRPTNLYGASKAWGEAAGSAHAARGLSFVAVRIGAYEAPWLAGATVADLTAYVSPRDLNALLARAVEAEGIDYAVVWGVSNNRPNRVDLTATRALLDWEPRDDGFALHGPGR